ncbi:MAG: hypothetical protein ACT4TC_24520 [Myxococcaceae bacterium]
MERDLELIRKLLVLSREKSDPGMVESPDVARNTRNPSCSVTFA